MLRLPLLAAAPLGALAITTHKDTHCWTPPYEEGFCCDPEFGESGNPYCWTEDFRYTRCCGVDVDKRQNNGFNRHVDSGPSKKEQEAQSTARKLL